MGQDIILRYNNCPVFFWLLKGVDIIVLSKEQIIKLLYKCVKEFDKNLANKRVMYIFETKDKHLEKIEIFFQLQYFII